MKCEHCGIDIRKGLRFCSRSCVASWHNKNRWKDPEYRAKLTAARRRVGNGVILVVDTQDPALTGTHFYLSENDVWLVDHVPPSALEVRK